MNEAVYSLLYVIRDIIKEQRIMPEGVDSRYICKCSSSINAGLLKITDGLAGEMQEWKYLKTNQNKQNQT
jgi:hypothetical protein